MKFEYLKKDQAMFTFTFGFELNRQTSKKQINKGKLNTNRKDCYCPQAKRLVGLVGTTLTFFHKLVVLLFVAHAHGHVEEDRRQNSRRTYDDHRQLIYVAVVALVAFGPGYSRVIELTGRHCFKKLKQQTQN